MDRPKGEEVVYALTVPCAPDSIAVLEDLCEAFIRGGNGAEEGVALLLRLSVAEACRNALRQRDPHKPLNLATLRFLRVRGADGKASLALEVEDPGLGLPVLGLRPAYPGDLVGGEHLLRKVLGQVLKARVETPERARLLYSEAPADFDRVHGRFDLIQGIQESGFGLVAIARCWESVVFTHDPANGTLLRLDGPRTTR